MLEWCVCRVIWKVELVHFLLWRRGGAVAFGNPDPATHLPAAAFGEGAPATPGLLLQPNES